MRVNVYSNEMTNRLEVVEKKTPAGQFVGVRFFIETPVTIKNIHGMKSTFRGPFEMVDGDDDSSAVTFWCKASQPEPLLNMLRKALSDLDRFCDPQVG